MRLGVTERFRGNRTRYQRWAVVVAVLAFQVVLLQSYRSANSNDGDELIVAVADDGQGRSATNESRTSSTVFFANRQSSLVTVGLASATSARSTDSLTELKDDGSTTTESSAVESAPTTPIGPVATTFPPAAVAPTTTAPTFRLISKQHQ